MKFNKYILNKDFIFKDKQIILTESGKSKIAKFKKITGSRMGAVLGNDRFMTPFQAWCEMLDFYTKEPDENSSYFLKAGNVIEKILKDYAEEKMKKTFKTYDPKKVKYDIFKDNNVFGGIPDGEEYDKYGNLISILEIKTAQLDSYKWFFEKNEFRLEVVNKRPVVKEAGAGLVKWFRNGDVVVPHHYEDQLSLYLYLSNVKRGYFCVAFIKDEDYVKPGSIKFISEFNNYKNYDAQNKTMAIDKAGHILIWLPYDLNRSKYVEKIEYAKDWYKNHVLKGVSPKMSSSDLEWFRYGYPNLV